MNKGSANMALISFCILLTVTTFSDQVYTQSVNPSILQDTRDLPKVDGTFGFLYRTEDGIAHAAKGEAGGIVHGRFTYTDPTGLKVNYNYNAGSRVAPGYNYEAQPIRRARINPQLVAEAQRYDESPVPRPTYSRRPASRERHQQQEAYDDRRYVEQPRRSRPVLQRNEIQNNYDYRS